MNSVHTQLIIWRLEPSAVVIRMTRAALSVSLTLLSRGSTPQRQTFHLDIGQPGRKLFSVKLERQAYPGDPLPNHVPLASAGQLSNM